MSIRAFVLSDLHIGDPCGMAVATKGSFEPIRIRKEFLDFLDRVEAMTPQEKKPLLVLAGDVWDIAIDNIDEIATLSWTVFDALKPRLASFESILFLPGNHDHALWTLLQTQTCIIRPMDERAKGDRSAKVFPLPHSQEALLDFREGPHPELKIPGVKPPYTGNVFLTGFTGGNIPVNISYPNLAIRRADGTNLVVTHGQFFEQAWTLLSDLFLPAVGRQLPPGRDLASLEMLNASLTDFINYSLAQMGPLNHVLQEVYEDFRVGRKPPQLDPVLRALRQVLDRAAGGDDPRTLKEALVEWASDRLIDFRARPSQAGPADLPRQRPQRDSASIRTPDRHPRQSRQAREDRRLPGSRAPRPLHPDGFRLGTRVWAHPREHPRPSPRSGAGRGSRHRLLEPRKPRRSERRRSRLHADRDRPRRASRGVLGSAGLDRLDQRLPISTGDVLSKGPTNKKTAPGRSGCRFERSCVTAPAYLYSSTVTSWRTPSTVRATRRVLATSVEAETAAGLALTSGLAVPL